MIIREATVNDKENWDSFVEIEGGSFFHYFEWKNIYDVKKWRYIPLLLENNASQIIGILPMVKINGFLYSRLVSLPEGACGGFLFKKDLTKTKKSQAIQMILDYVEQNYSKGCSTFTLKENLSLIHTSSTTPTRILVNHGFKFRYNEGMKLPCTYFLELTESFEDDIWYETWNKYLRNHIRKSQKRGVYVKEDTNLQHMNDYIDMFTTLYKRLHSHPLSKEEIILRLMNFKGKTKIWVAFLEDKPIALLLCYYMPSICYGSKMVYYDSARKNYATNLLFYEAIKDACDNGYKLFEFGVTLTSSLAYWKEQFVRTKIPMRIYEKKYSTTRTFFEKVPRLINWSLNNKQYVWNNRRRIINKIMKEGL
jgi:hypothetical protein